MSFGRTVQKVRLATCLAGLAIIAQVGHANPLSPDEKSPASRINYTVTWEASYDSNVYARRDSNGDFSSSAYVGMSQQRLSLVNADFAAGLKAGWFRRLTGENFLNPSASLGLWTAVSALELRLRGGLTRSQISEALTGTRMDVWQNQLSTMFAKIELAGFQGASGYEWSRQDYVSDEGTDLTTDSVFLSLQRALRDRRVFNLSVRTSRDSSANERARDWVGLAGFSEQVFPKVTGQISGGVQTRESSRDGGRTTVFIGNAELAWNANSRTSITQLFDRAVRTNVIGRSQLDLSYATTIRQRIYTGWTGSLSFRRSRADVFDGVKAVDRSQTIGLAVTRDVGTGLVITLQSSWTENRAGANANANFDRQTTSLNVSRKW